MISASWMVLLSTNQSRGFFIGHSSIATSLQLWSFLFGSRWLQQMPQPDGDHINNRVQCTTMWDNMLPHITPPIGYFCTIFYIWWACDVTSQSTTTQTTNTHHHLGDGAARPSSGMDLMNPLRPSGGRPCACLFWGHCWRVLVEQITIFLSTLCFI